MSADSPAPASPAPTGVTTEQQQHAGGKTSKSEAAPPNQQREPELSQDALLRAIDARVAEKVMGWESRGPHPLFGTPVYHHRRGPTGEGDSLLPRFSTDIAAAWLVAEQMRATGFHFDLADRRSRPGDTWWSVKFWRDGMSRQGTVAQAESAALAICHAALEAV